MVTNFVVNRSTLLTGSALRAVEKAGGQAEFFHEKTRLWCIVGQYLYTLGVSAAHLKHKWSVEQLSCALPIEAAWLQSDSTNLASTAAVAVADANDGRLHQTRRETKLRKLFAQQGITVNFIGRYDDATRAAKRRLRA